MNMKKLLTFLFALLMISSVSFGSGLMFQWVGGAAAGPTDWQISANWNITAYQGGTATWPGQNSATEKDDYVIFDDSNIWTITNVPTCTLGRLEITRIVAFPPNPPTDITLIPSQDGNTITINGGVVFANLWHVRIDDGCALHCNTPNQQVKIVCEPGVNFWQKDNAIFDPATYNSCLVDKGFILQANANDHAEFIQQLSTNQSVKGYCEYYMDINKYHYVSCPITTVVPPVAEYLTQTCRSDNTLCVFNGDYLRKFTNGGGWQNWMGACTLFNPLIGNPIEIETGRGYEYYGHPSSPSIHTFYGIFNSGSGTVPTIPLPVTTAGWNLIGNPFASAITFGEYGGGATAGQGWTWNKNYTDPVAYWWDNCGGGFYRSYNWNTGIPQLPIIPACNNIDVKVIPRGQGFFVHVSQFDPVNSFHVIKLTNLARVFRNSYPIGKAAAENQLNLSLKDASDNVIDYMYFGFREDGANEFNNLLDAYKIYNDVTNPSQLYCKTTDDIDVSVKVLKLAAGNIMYPVYMKVINTGTYSIDASNLNTFSQNTGILLKDNKTNTTVDLKVNPKYTFTATAGDDDARFSLYFTDVLYGIDNLKNNNFTVYSFNNSIFIQNNDPKGANGTVLVYDMIGKQMMVENLNNNGITRISTNLNTGFYIVSIKTNQGAFNQKVYIN
jgi:hypothetical protein